MQRCLLLIVLLFGVVTASRAQSDDQFSIVPTGNHDVTGLRITVQSGTVPVFFRDDRAAVLANVHLYRIATPNRPTVHNVFIDCAFAGIDPNNLSNEIVTLTMAPLATCAHLSPDGFPLAAGSYFLEIKTAALRYAGNGPAPALNDVYPTFSVKAPSATIDTAGDVAHRYDEIRVSHPDIPVSTAGVASTRFQRIAPRLTPDNDIVESTNTITASYAPSPGEPPGTLIDGTPLEFRIRPHLSDGQQYLLRGPDGLVDAWNRPVKGEGKLKLPDVPKTDDDAKITGNLSMQAAVHQAAVFQLTGKFSPLTRDYFAFKRDPNDRSKFTDYWDPSLVVDIGLRSTKSANSIVATGLYRHWVNGPDKDLVDSSKPCIGNASPNAVLVGYQRWAKSSVWPTCFSDIRFAIGPRVETDRNFKRLNTLGEIRADFDVYRWHGTIADRRKLILLDLKTCRPDNPLCKKVTGEADFLEGPDFGFSFVPYVELDGGGHVNEEKVTNTKPVASEIVPRHAIFRVYTGGVAELDYKRATLKLDSAMTELALPETIGFTTSSGVAFRRLSGIQPHTKASIDFSFDPAKHYSWNVTYENGRSAPNFEYLNKVSSGIKVIY